MKTKIENNFGLQPSLGDDECAVVEGIMAEAVFGGQGSCGREGPSLSTAYLDCLHQSDASGLYASQVQSKREVTHTKLEGVHTNSEVVQTKSTQAA